LLCVCLSRLTDAPGKAPTPEYFPQSCQKMALLPNIPRITPPKLKKTDFT
jgi:hypothetical protein